MHTCTIIQELFVSTLLIDEMTMFVCCEGEPEELIKHGLRALRETLPNEQELTTKVYCDHLLWQCSSKYMIC